MLDRNLALKIFEGFSIERWNDLVRPLPLIEMDKSAEKTVLAYIIGKFEEQGGAVIDWEWLIYASFFDLLKKIALCDIKSPVQRMIRRQYPEQYKKLNDWVVLQYRDLLRDPGLLERFEEYVRDSAAETRENTLTKRVHRAAHKLSTMREFEMIAGVNEPFRRHEIEKGLNTDIESYLDLRAVQLFITRQRPYDFLMVIETLRFQTRWNQTPRIPKTSVLGHSFFVAVLTLLMSLEQSTPFSKNRIYNNFFSALFHDLPESVTRDIISPVKQATQDLPSVVKEIEEKIVAHELLPLMEDFYKDELLYFTADEFENRVKLPDGVHFVSYEDLNERYNDGQYSPVDGKLVRAADHIAAFLEADLSIKYGITSSHLTDGKNNILNMYAQSPVINGFDIASFFTE